MRKNNKWIWFDLDGTLVNLYGVKGWLEDLIALRTRPYAVAEEMYDVVDLLEVLADLRGKGYNLGVISWGSKANNDEFDKRVEQVKIEWLKNRFLDVMFDKIIVTPYGVCKADTCRPYGVGILVDDEEQNRNAWNLGTTINANENILEALRGLLM